MIIKDIGFIKYIIDLPEKKKTWATIVVCGMVVIFQQRANDIRIIEKDNAHELKFEKYRAEKNSDIKGLLLEIKIANADKYENMREFKELYFETQRMRTKLRENDSILQKKN